MYCPYCGNSISESINFCPNCGAAIKETSTAVSVTNTAAGEYSLILVSRGTCTAATAADLLEDIFGYSETTAANLVKAAPVIVGQKMTADEAAYVAQMFSEYGIEMSIQDANEQYVDLSSRAVSSVFDSSGNLLTNVLAVIGGLSVLNRVTSFTRVKKPSLLERIFRPLFTPKKPPVHRRYVRPKREPEPARPAPRQSAPVYRNSGERIQRPDNGHRGGPNGRMKAPSSARNTGKPSNNGPGGGRHDR